MRTEKPEHCPWPAGNLSKKKRGGLESPECTRLSPGWIGDLAARYAQNAGKILLSTPRITKHRPCANSHVSCHVIEAPFPLSANTL